MRLWNRQPQCMMIRISAGTCFQTVASRCWLVLALQAREPLDARHSSCSSTSPSRNVSYAARFAHNGRLPLIRCLRLPPSPCTRQPWTYVDTAPAHAIATPPSSAASAAPRELEHPLTLGARRALHLPHRRRHHRHLAFFAAPAARTGPHTVRAPFLHTPAKSSPSCLARSNCTERATCYIGYTRVATGCGQRLPPCTWATRMNTRACCVAMQRVSARSN